MFCCIMTFARGKSLRRCLLIYFRRSMFLGADDSYNHSLRLGTSAMNVLSSTFKEKTIVFCPYLMEPWERLEEIILKYKLMQSLIYLLNILM